MQDRRRWSELRKSERAAGAQGSRLPAFHRSEDRLETDPCCPKNRLTPARTRPKLKGIRPRLQRFSVASSTS